MNPRRFDDFAKLVARSRFSRRGVFRAGGAGLVAGALGGGRAAAQGTPVAGEQAAENNSTLFVQTATGGTVRPNPRAGQAASPGAATPTAKTPGDYLLTLHGHNGETIAFSDRPQRNFGEVKTPTFFDAMDFTPVNPPNATLVADTARQEDTVTILELMTPHYDAETQTLTYEANALQDYPNDRGNVLTPLAARAQGQMPAGTLATASLFIDDCADQVWGCYPRTGPNPNGAVGFVQVGRCWKYFPPGCDWSNCTHVLDPDSRCNQSGFDCGPQGCIACTSSPIAVATGEGGECL